MGPSGNTFLGRNWDPRPGSEFTIFGLVIRLSKVEQLAIFHFSPCRLSLAEQLAAVPGFAFFRFSPCRLSLVEQPAAVPGFHFLLPAVETSVLNFDRGPASGIATRQGSGFRTCLSGVVTFFWLIWRGQVVHECEG